MKILQKISEDLVPLSSKQNVVLLIIISFVFQFIFFYAPAFADETGKQVKLMDGDAIIRLDSMVKASEMDTEAAKMRPILPQAEDKPIKVIKVSTHTITAYNSEPGQTDDSPCITANGFNVCEHGQEDTIAANFLPFGAKVQIPDLFGERVFVVRDRMNKRHTSRVDIWMKDKDDAIQFGIKVAKIQVIE